MTSRPPSAQEALPLGAPASYGAADYLVTDANRLAHAMLMRWPDWPERRMVLSGPPASGKTHLARLWAGHAGARILEGGELLAPVRETEGAAFLLDGAENAPEETLFHLLNLAQERRAYLLLVATEGFRPALPDLASRWKSLPQARLQAPDDALLRAVLVKQFADRQLRVGSEVVDYLERRMERSLAEAQRLVEALDRHALQAQRAITLPLAREVLESMKFAEI